jgi:hypothetical protein
MTVEMPPEAKAVEQPDVPPAEPSLDDLLWALLVGEAKVRIDPDREQSRPGPKDHP